MEGGEAVAPAVAENGIMIPQVISKHDEKWNNMLDKLVQYKVRPWSLMWILRVANGAQSHSCACSVSTMASFLLNRINMETRWSLSAMRMIPAWDAGFIIRGKQSQQ